MGARGPAAKDPSELTGHHSKSVLAGDGWEEIDPDAAVPEAPELPDWVETTDVGRAVYDYLTSIPQAQKYGPGTHWVLWMSIPLIERYLAKPGSENYKAILSTLGSALRLTEDDLARARIRMVSAAEASDDPSETSQQNAKVIAMQERRNRLKGG
ncbi:hypothetical protein SEA_SPEEDDEMON_120 [Gordonia phage SpeedDemon]|uniref:Uncharacterized protein n=1 Tax=Gordonia phage Bantam TaxID=1887641 RepID=A0A1B3AY83_9CAUD|nr:hypothetical protein BIZ77_gp167 [Gordonia phage Bantam]AOE43701.1 hypothetical protein SEA_BANTAM_11 [Gordonia phage Bantam]QNL30463.1 hypothetical protein SEA_SPEEDDEMON_120 [Gordonia phage SpeedDemon]